MRVIDLRRVWHPAKQHDGWTQQARLWTCVVKDVGARGTEMIRAAFWPVKERDKALFRAWQCEHAEWKARQREALLDKGRKGERAEGPGPNPSASAS